MWEKTSAIANLYYSSHNPTPACVVLASTPLCALFYSILLYLISFVPQFYTGHIQEVIKPDTHRAAHVQKYI